MTFKHNIHNHRRRVYNYKIISDISKVAVAVSLISLYAFPFLTLNSNIMGQEFQYKFSNTGVTASTNGLFTGDSVPSEKMPYMTYLEAYKNKNDGQIPTIYKIAIYMDTHVIAFPDTWLLLSVLLIGSIFLKYKKYMAVPATITILYYIYLMYAIYEAVQYLGYHPNISDLFTGIPIANKDSFLGFRTSEMFILKLGYGWYISLLSNVILLHENL